MGTNLRVLLEGYPMNTNMTAFRWFSKNIFLSCALDESILSIGWVKTSKIQKRVCSATHKKSVNLYVSLPATRRYNGKLQSKHTKAILYLTATGRISYPNLYQTYLVYDIIIKNVKSGFYVSRILSRAKSIMSY